MTLEATLRFIAVFASGLVAGGLFLSAAAIAPALARLGDELTLRYKQVFDSLVDRINPPGVIVSSIAALLLLILVDDAPGTSTAATIVGLVGSFGVGVMSAGVNMRINRQIGRWSPGAPPAELHRLMRRWNATHAIRTLAGVTAFAGYLVGVLAAID
jgi:uncharacterized membrane protein